MPIYLHKLIQSDGHLGVWQILEEEHYFLKRLDLFEAEELFLAKIKGAGRRKEWLASRWLLHHLSERPMRGACLKDDFGKPYLENSNFHISMSHSNDMAAVIALPGSCGIDIQKMVPKIERLASKFCNMQELDQIKIAHDRLFNLHLIWGAKESMFKSYGRKSVDFKKDMSVKLPNDNSKKEFTGTLIKDGIQYDHKIHYDIILDYVIVYSSETSSNKIDSE